MRTLQAAWPRTAITWVIGRTEHSLLKGADGIEFITFDKHDPRGSLGNLRRQLRGRRYPILLHMQASLRASLLSTRVSADARVGFDRARARDGQWLFTNQRIRPAVRPHVMDGLFGFTEHLGIRERVMRWDFALTDEDLAPARGLPGGGPLCVISPCSSQRFRNYRNWPVAHYVAVARHLVDRFGAHIVLTGGSTELEGRYGEAIAAAIPGAATNQVGRTSLKALLGILQRADVLIGPDSGPVHMATAAGTPVVGLYATSNPERTGPYFSRHLVVNRYPEAVRREFGRPVEALRWGERVRDPQAMDLIRPGDVLDKVTQALREGRAGISRGQTAGGSDPPPVPA